ncbi:ASCH domain-containing protein [Vibrio diabolicus]|uniref:ASCH domain-containing protein n=1 Tax=Vibrio diabolicus TaxID=50719 RepID=UPI00211B3148|nr:ASCH domain-containing protein [Vibrio diabolicus]MCG9230973.1 ASCH domain-containing protein [Vibrio diabolicus]MCG9574501.1 ASCH domain-containing protein [Vibrio diabolicus]MCG9593671.1 ASCH domain-containing protein [Vibrio diabolicus]
MDARYVDYFQAYASTLSESQLAEIGEVETTYFCDDEYNTNECARLVSIGQKRATCSVKEAYRIEGEEFPKVGQYQIVLDWEKNPVCIVKITNVDFCPFGQVSREFAESEGEGDGTYEWWYKAHNDFFTRDCKSAYGIEFNDSTELVLVTFELVHK